MIVALNSNEKRELLHQSGSMIDRLSFSEPVGVFTKKKLETA